MPSLLKRIKSKLFIASYRKATHALEGEYLSLMRGRSMDFDELREYVPGDDVKDIDWKASARHSSPLVKQYVANRKKPVYFVVDGGKNMKALSTEFESKKDIVVDIVGVLGFLTVKHSDTVGLIVGDALHVHRIPQRETESHLERILENVESRIESSENDGDIIKLLDFITRSTKSKGLVVVVADELSFNEKFDVLLRKIKANHEIVWISVSDGNPLNVESNDVLVEDIETGETIPSYLRNKKNINESIMLLEQSRRNDMENYFKRLGISHAIITKTSETIPVLLKLLERRIRERRR